jgi:DNA-binding winged helix-turn-helix (wHTH) protein
VTPALLRFEDFELDSLRYELRRNGPPLKLEKIPMELLQLLAESDGRLVMREEIEVRLWGKDVFVDAEHGINTAVRKIRQVLGDDPDQPRFVQTVQRKGYRFVAEVRREMAGSPALPAGSQEPAPTAPLQAPPSLGEFASERPRADQTTFWSKRVWLAIGASVVLLAAWPTYRLAVSRSAMPPPHLP